MNGNLFDDGRTGKVQILMRSNLRKGMEDRNYKKDGN